MTKVGDLLDATIRAGVNKIERSFPRSSASYARDLRKQALADARAKAEEVAKEAGMELGLPVSIEVDPSSNQYSFMARSVRSDKYETIVPIAPGSPKESSVAARGRWLRIEVAEIGAVPTLPAGSCVQ